MPVWGRKKNTRDRSGVDGGRTGPPPGFSFTGLVRATCDTRRENSAVLLIELVYFRVRRYFPRAVRLALVNLCCSKKMFDSLSYATELVDGATDDKNERTVSLNKAISTVGPARRAVVRDGACVRGG